MLAYSTRALRALALLLCLELAVFAAVGKKTPRNKDLTKQITAILSQPELARAHWGVDALDVESGKVIYSVNPDQLFLPASNAKLFTT
ncbi:MAG: D-alanyl-D-alanine carboxypeptidase, partial [Candidatus Angelobacter sp.]